ncbi:MAG: hypothetical protein JO048_17390 [Methylobacteriaceae bacterium]|nr:hypothetical protein [Methylobacteriaceae bacterium]
MISSLLLTLQRRLLARASGRRTGGSPRIAVIGNCQATALAAAMDLLLPKADVRAISVYRLAQRYPSLSDLVADLAGSDVVFATAFATRFRDGGTFEDLRAAVPLVAVPTLVFPAFHPDLVYVGDPTDAARGFLRGPIGTYHSALALFGYLEGFDERRTARLFTADIYRRLGYLDLWQASADTLLKLGRDAQYDLAEELLRWTRRGPFMHTINHPKMFAVNDLARGLLRKAGIPFADCDLDSYAPDEIVKLGSWPVYPPIAEQYGAAGSEVFLAPATKRSPPRTMGLAELLRDSFAAYGAAAPDRLVNDRVALWRGAEEIRGELARATA